jgi:hypothetical protein
VAVKTRRVSQRDELIWSDGQLALAAAESTHRKYWASLSASMRREALDWSQRSGPRLRLLGTSRA